MLMPAEPIYCAHGAGCKALRFPKRGRPLAQRFDHVSELILKSILPRNQSSTPQLVRSNSAPPCPAIKALLAVEQCRIDDLIKRLNHSSWIRAQTAGMKVNIYQGIGHSQKLPEPL